MSLLQIHEPGETPVPHEESGDVAVGIDLGTTNSVVAISEGGKPEVLRDEDGRALVPSVVAYAPDGSAIVGELAKRLLLDRPESVVSSIKRLMGRGVNDLKTLQGTHAYDIDGDSDNNGGMVRLTVSGQKLTPVEISSQILGALRDRAEAHLGRSVAKAVVTVPAYFDDAARSATKDAARLAGLEVLRLVNEPTAAALAYGLDEGAEGLYAIYDLGGGTFDLSVLRMEKGVFQVLATGGDAALGGDDFDHAIADHFLTERAKDLGETTLTTAETKVALMTARLAKECLTAKEGEHEDSAWVLDSSGEQSSHTLDRATMNGLIASLVDQTLSICGHVLDDAGIKASDIKGVVLVGGSTRVPLVRERVGVFFGQQPLADINPDEVVAVGAALQAEALSVGSDTLLLDVTPLSLGIETMGGLVEKVIPRNTPIPVAKAQEFTTFKDGQTAMAIHVVQGEREMVDQNRSLARFDLHGIPPMTAGAARIRVTFAVDADGLLTVTAGEESTGVQAEVAVKPSYGITDEDMSRMLRESLVHAQDDMETRLLAEARVEARRVLEALDAALGVDGDLLDARARAAIDGASGAVRAAVEGTERDAISIAQATLEEATHDFAEARMDRGIREALSGQSVDNLEKATSGS